MEITSAIYTKSSGSDPLTLYHLHTANVFLHSLSPQQQKVPRKLGKRRDASDSRVNQAEMPIGDTNQESLARVQVLEQRIRVIERRNQDLQSEVQVQQESSRTFQVQRDTAQEQLQTLQKSLDEANTQANDLQQRVQAAEHRTEDAERRAH